MNQRLLFLAFLLFAFDMSVAQELPSVIPPSPETAAFAETADINVGLYTGTMQTSIPLYVLEGRNLSVPISLNYSTNGVKVNNMSTWVGTGWNLNAGGVITRYISGEKDEIYNILDVDTGCLTGTENTYLNADGNDFVSDVFSCNVLGQTFEFYLDPNNNPQFQELTDWKITYDKNTQTFTVTDTDGTVYTFGGGRDIGQWIENSPLFYTEHTSIGVSPDFVSGVTSWYLNNITHFTGEQINFEYLSRYYTYPTDRIYSSTHVPPLGGSSGSTSAYSTNTSALKVNGVYLSKITSDFDEVTFGTFERADLQLESKMLSSLEGNKSKIEFDYDDFTLGENGRYFLDAITFKSATPSYTFLKSYSFEYDNPDLLPNRLTDSQDHWGYNNGVTTNDHLLVYHDRFTYTNPADREVYENVLPYGTLTKIIYPTGGEEIFEYESNHEVLNEIGEAYFNFHEIQPDTYGINDPNIPTIESTTGVFIPLNSGPFELELDVSRYIEMGAHYSALLNYTLVDVEQVGENPIVLQGVLNSNNNSATLTGQVNGGWLYKLDLEFTGSEAQYTARFTYPGTLLNVKKHWGGVRLKKRTSNPLVGQSIVKEYLYPDIETATFLPYERYSNDMQVGGVSTWNWKNSSNRKTHEMGPNSRDYYYKKVIEKSSNNAQIEHYFGGITKLSLHTIMDHTYYNPSAYFEPKALVRGNIKEYKTVHLAYDNVLQTNTKVKEIDYDYDLQILDNISVSYIRRRNHVSTSWPSENSTGCYSPIINNLGHSTVGGVELRKYYIRKFEQKLKKVTVTDYFNNEIDELVQITDYKYEGNNHNQVTTTITTDSEGEGTISKTYYPSDKSLLSGLSTLASDAAESLEQENRIAEPLQTEVYKDINDDDIAQSSELLSTQRTDYKKWTVLYPNFEGVYVPVLKPLPEFISVSKGDNPLEQRIEFKSYYTNGNIKEVSKKDGTTIVYVWGYDNKYPIAKIENATYANIEALASFGTNFSITDGLSATQNSDLRGLSNAMVTTYTYDPLMGITSITDPRGYAIYYEYDEFNRLKQVKDVDGNILSENEYHY